MKRVVWTVLAIALLVILGVIIADPRPEPSKLTSFDMKITSTAFEHEGTVPSKYTCDGENISPPLTISEAPEGTQSFVLIMDDPDVPTSIRPDGNWDHWMVWNIPESTTEISEGQNPGGVVGRNTGGKIGYGGPCPPDREHRYFFKLYALDLDLDLLVEANKSEIEAAMEGHILEEAQLMGRYNRQK